MNNIDQFNKAAAMILTRLYGCFPHQIPFDFGDMDDDADIERLSFYMATMEFLEAEGFIRYKGQRLSGIFDGVCLTLKGMQALNKTPEPLKDKRSFAELLKDLLKEGSKNALREAVSLLFRGVVND